MSSFDIPRRHATAKELAWCRKMKRLMSHKPESITLFCNGSIHVLCTDAVPVRAY